MKHKSESEISTEIAELLRIRDAVRKTSFFGENNRHAIDAQIAVLKSRMIEDEVHERFGSEAFEDADEYCEHDFSNAMDALQWMQGESSDSEGLSPSELWMPLVDESLLPKKEKPVKKPAKRKQLITSDEAVDAKCQHTTPCSDCPWGRTALNKWLGGATIDEWIQTAHGDHKVDCHTLKGSECAGLAIYRSNVAKSSRADVLKLPADRVKVFATPEEFREHHSKFPGEKKKVKTK